MRKNLSKPPWLGRSWLGDSCGATTAEASFSQPVNTRVAIAITRKLNCIRYELQGGKTQHSRMESTSFNIHPTLETKSTIANDIILTRASLKLGFVKKASSTRRPSSSARAPVVSKGGCPRCVFHLTPRKYNSEDHCKKFH